jgi:F0F1-type ATP synthase assembly protein I
MNQSARILSGFLAFQALMVCVMAVFVGVVATLPAALSALLAGASVWVGNVIYFLLLAMPRSQGSIVWVFVGQLVKVVVTLGLLFVVVALYASIVWTGFISGLFVSLLVILVAPIWVAKSQKKYDAQRIDVLLRALTKE